MFKRIVLFALIFCLPFQLGYHFWLPGSFVKSFRIDYLSPTIYLTDLLILLFLALNYKAISRYLIRFLSNATGKLFLLLILLNLWTSGFSLVSLFAWLRFIEYLLLFVTLKETAGLAKKIIFPFSLSLGLIILLALLQFLFQSSLGGPLYFLGERPLSVAIPNIAKIYHPLSFLPSPLLRPYATFSHPNSLAGYLLISLVILRRITHPKIFKYLLVGTTFLTFSKSAILTLIIIELLRPSLARSIFLGAILSLLPLLKLDPSFSSRLNLFLPTLKIIGEHPLFGVGLRRFIPALANHLPDNQISYSTLQPVHNLFFLIIAEIGLLPILIIFTSILKSKILLDTRYYLLTTVIILTGALDHYWWTLPQNQLIIVLALALISNSKNSSLYQRRGSPAIAER